MSHLYAVKMGAVSKMKAFLKGKYFSLTMDHWTSLATDNYGAITLHLIDDFQLHAFVLSCVKHENGCTAIEMERQLLADMESWGLDRQYFVSCITDSASNMNSLGGLLDNWQNAPILRHYYCSDHILQLTAVHAFSGNITLGDGHDNSVGVIKKARNLVSHVNSSIIASDKIKSTQFQLSPSSTALKLVSDCETRWWSTHSLVERIVKLKAPLLLVFQEEFRHRERPNTETALEGLTLTEDDFASLEDILYLLTPFKNAQKALEGQFYVNFSLLPLIIVELMNQLTTCQGAVDPEEQEAVYDLITGMLSDFKVRWGASIAYHSDTVRETRNRQRGIPTYSFWAMALDPRTKKKLNKVLSQFHRDQLWKDITAAVMTIAFEMNNNNVDNNECIGAAPQAVAVARGRPKAVRVGSASFIPDSSDEDDEDAAAQDGENLEFLVKDELKRYQACKGIKLRADNGDYLCPLEWWKKHHITYPNVWQLAQSILAIPATSAPSERVFSAAAHQPVFPIVT